MPFQLFRDMGEWSAYECGEEWGIPTREAAEAAVRARQRDDLADASESLAIARAKIIKAEAALSRPVRVDMLKPKKKGA